MNKAEILKRVLGILDDQLGGISNMRPESRLEDDLGADSLDMIEIVMAIEDEFSIEIGDVQIERIVTVQDAVDLVAEIKGVTS